MGAAVIASVFTVVLMYSLPVLAAAGGNFILGQSNSSSEQTTLKGNTGSPNLKINNTGNDPALRLETDSSAAPMAVTSGKKVSKLNADKVDGKSASAFLQKSTYDADKDDVADNAEKLSGNPINEVRTKVAASSVGAPTQADGVVLDVDITTNGPGTLVMQGIIDTAFTNADSMTCRLDRDGTNYGNSDIDVDSASGGEEIPCATMATEFLATGGTHTISLEVAGFDATNMDMDDTTLIVQFVPSDLIIFPITPPAIDVPDAQS